jgi:hypothetical protein
LLVFWCGVGKGRSVFARKDLARLEGVESKRSEKHLDSQYHLPLAHNRQHELSQYAPGGIAHKVAERPFPEI